MIATGMGGAARRAPARLWNRERVKVQSASFGLDRDPGRHPHEAFGRSRFRRHDSAPTRRGSRPPVIQSGSVVRVRANNGNGILKQTETTPAFGLAVTDSIVDSEFGTPATATSTATYNISLVGSTATFAITVDRNYTVGSLATLAEGFIRFTLAEATAAMPMPRPASVR